MSDGFVQRLWDASPPKARERSSRCEVQAAWKKLKPQPDPETVLSAMEAWKASDDWQREAGRGIPGLHRWLAKGRYENPPEPAKPENMSRIAAPPDKYVNIGHNLSGLDPCEPKSADEVRRIMRDCGLLPDPAEMADTLRGLGIRQADELANMPGVNPAMIDQAVAKVGKTDPGKLHNAIADAAAKLAEQHRSRIAQQQRLETEAERRERERAEQAEQQARDQAAHNAALEVIGGLDDDTLARLRDQHVSTLPAFFHHPDRVPSVETLRSRNGALPFRAYRLAIAKLAEAQP